MERLSKASFANLFHPHLSLCHSTFFLRTVVVVNSILVTYSEGLQAVPIARNYELLFRTEIRFLFSPTSFSSTRWYDV